MTKFRFPLALVAAAAVTALLAAAAVGSAGKVMPFKAAFKGTATTKVTGDRVDITAKGTGTGTPIGKSALAGVGVGTKSGDAACVPFTGPGTIVTGQKLTPKSTKKAIIKFTVTPTSTGCGSDDGNTVTATGSVKVAGGTGLYKKARGILTFSGYYDRTSGAFTVKFTGSLRV
jgi:hypothetical protein